MVASPNWVLNPTLSGLIQSLVYSWDQHIVQSEKVCFTERV